MLRPYSIVSFIVGTALLLVCSDAWAVPKPPKPSPPKPPKPPNSAINHLHSRNAAAQQNLQRAAAAKQQQNNAANNAAKQQLSLQRAKAAQTNQDNQARNKEQQLLLKEREKPSDQSRGRTGEVWRDSSNREGIEGGPREAPITTIQPPASPR